LVSASRALKIKITVISMVRTPPAWNASRGMNDIPTMTQKMASEAKAQARNTVSKATRRKLPTAPFLFRVQSRQWLEAYIAPGVPAIEPSLAR
jgi:hypothetical protein